MLYDSIEGMPVDLFKKFQEKCRGSEVHLLPEEVDELKRRRLMVGDEKVPDNIAYSVSNYACISGGRIRMMNH